MIPLANHDRSAGPGLEVCHVWLYFVYPKSTDVLRAAGLQPLRYYIQKRSATVAETIADRPVLEEYRGAERLRGTPVLKTWWGQVLTRLPLPIQRGRAAERLLPWGPSGAVIGAVIPARLSSSSTAPGIYLSGYVPGGAADCTTGGVGGAGPWRGGRAG